MPFLFLVLLLEAISNCDAALSKILSANILSSASSCNFDKFIEICSQHFDSDRATFIFGLGNANKEQEADELAKQVYQKMHRPLFNGRKERTSIFRNRLNQHNFIIVDFFKNNEYPSFNDFLPIDNVIIYMDTAKFENESILRDYLNNITEDVWKTFVRSVIFIHNLTTCDNQLWTRQFKNSLKMISSLEKAYFNQKMNFLGAPLLFISYFNELMSGKNEIKSGKDKAIRDYILKNWNFTLVENPENDFYDYDLYISNEPIYDPGVTYAYAVMPICLVIQSRLKFPIWQVLFRSLEWQVWGGILAGLILSTFIDFLIQKAPRDLYLSFVVISGLYISFPVGAVQKIQRFNLRIHFISIILISIVLINGSQSSLYSLLGSPRYYPAVNQLIQIKDSDLTIVCKYNILCAILFEKAGGLKAADPVMRGIEKNWLPASNLYAHQSYSLNDVYANASLAFMTSCESAANSLNQIRKLKRLYIMQERILTAPLMMSSQDFDFPYFNRAFNVLLLFYQNGIAQWWDSFEEWKSLMIILFQEKDNENFRIFSLEDLQIAFLIFILGNLIAFIVFILELKMYFTVNKFRKRQFNPYIP